MALVRPTLSRLLASALIGALLLAGSPARAADVPPGETVRIRTEDGLTLGATWWKTGPDGGPAALLLHMFSGARGSWKAAVPELLARGISVLAIDLRGHGESARQGATDLAPRVKAFDEALFRDMHQDVLAALTWLMQDGGRDPRRIAGIGASVGGSVLVDAARRYPDRFRGLLWLTPAARYLGLDGAASAREVLPTVPVALLAHREEEAGLRAVRGAFEGARKDVEGAAPVRSRVVDAAYPPGVTAKDRAFHGVKLLGAVPLLESWIADWAASVAGDEGRRPLVDGDVSGDEAAWSDGVEVGAPEGASVRALVVDGKRLLLGGRVPQGATRLLVRVHVFQGGGGSAEAFAGLDGSVELPAGDMTEGTTDASDPAGWPQPPLQVLLGEASGGSFPFEGEVRFPRLLPEGPLQVWVAVGYRRSGGDPGFLPGVQREDPSTWTKVLGE